VHIDASTPVSAKIFIRRAASRQLTVGTWLVVLALGIFAANGEVLRRQPNATLKMPLTAPEPGFTSELAFNDLRFIQPVAIASPPGETNRLFIVEKWGHVCVITNLAAPTKTVFLDLWDRVPHDVTDSDFGLLSIAFHPGYATNGYFFVFYHLFATTGAGAGRSLAGRALRSITRRSELRTSGVGNAVDHPMARYGRTRRQRFAFRSGRISLHCVGDAESDAAQQSIEIFEWNPTH
jgi:hypothetical protein